MNMNRKHLAIGLIIGTLVLSGLLGLTASVAASQYSEGDCDHRVTASLPNGNWTGVWITSDPGELASLMDHYTMTARSLIVAEGNITITGVPVNNTWSCFFSGNISQDRMRELVIPLVPAQLVRVNLMGFITAEDVPVDFSWTPVPTDTPTATPTPIPVVFRVYAPIIMVSPLDLVPTTTPTVVFPYVEDNCSARADVAVSADWTSAWTTTDPQVLTTTVTSVGLPGRSLILADSGYTLATSTNSWTCSFNGSMPESRKWELLNPPAWLVEVDSAGNVEMTEYIAPGTPAPTPTPAVPVP